MTSQMFDFTRIVRHQTDASQVHVGNDGGGRIVPSQIIGQPQMTVGLNRIQSIFLQTVGGDFIGQSDATAFLRQVDHHAPTFIADGLQRKIQLVGTIAL